jgi:superfamily II DNA or RNA helicase
MIEDRPYQADILAEFMRTTARYKRIILVAPTGAGKTVIAAEIIKDYVRRHKTALVIAHRREVIRQTKAKLHDLDYLHFKI